MCGISESATQGFLAKLDAGFATALIGADVAGGAGVADGLTFFDGAGLDEDAAELGFAGAGAAVFLFAGASLEFFATHGGAGAVAAEVEDGDGGGVLRRHCGWQGDEGVAQAGGNLGDEATEIAGIKPPTGVGGEIVGSFLIGTALAGSPAEEAGDGGGEGAFECKGGI